MTNREKIDKQIAELEDARKLVAFYQGEGEDDIPEETEWKDLVQIPEGKRSKKQKARLKELSIFIMEELSVPKLRAERDNLRTVNLSCHKLLAEHQGHSVIIDAAGENLETYLITCMDCDCILFGFEPGGVPVDVSKYEDEEEKA